MDQYDDVLDGEELYPEYRELVIPAGRLQAEVDRFMAGPLRLEFLEQLFGGLEGALSLVQMTPASTRSRWYDASTIPKMAHDAGMLEGNIYFGCASRTERLAGNKRGGAIDCHQVGILWLDLDVNGPHHPNSELPPDYDSARRLLACMPLRPSCVTDTGGGLQAVWVLGAPVSREDAEPFLKRWKATWDELGRRCGQAAGHRQGWQVDNPGKIDQLMRVPGTINSKTECEDNVVRVVEAHWDRRYSLRDFEEHLVNALIASVRTQQFVPPPKGGERPGDAYNRRKPIQEELASLGFVLHHEDSGNLHWTRPGKDPRDGPSATVYADASDKVHIFTQSLTEMGIEANRAYDAFGLYTATHYPGNFEEASRALRKQGYGDPGTSDSWDEGESRPAGRRKSFSVAIAKEPDKARSPGTVRSTLLTISNVDNEIITWLWEGRGFHWERSRSSTATPE